MPVPIITLLDNFELTTTITTAEFNTYDEKFSHLLDRERLLLLCDITAVEGTNPTLNCSIRICTDEGDFEIDMMMQMTTVSKNKHVCELSPDCVKMKFTVGGTAAKFTMSVYATRV